MSQSLIYLDNNATTPMDRRVLEAMLPYFCDRFGNAASRSHQFGWEAAQAVDTARQQAASLIGASAKDLIWTSGSTEANNLAIKGAAGMYGKGPDAKGKHIITSIIEHKAVVDPCKRLELEGFDVTYLQPDANGVVTVDQVAQAVRDDTFLVSIMWANNEIGTINQIPAIGALCHEKDMIFHTDATQYIGKLPCHVEEAGIDLMSWSGHKMYGPKGVGALYVRRRRPRIRLEPILDGGGHERGMRSGTLNVPGIVGFGQACQLSQQLMAEEAPRLARLRDKLENALLAAEGVHVNGDPKHRMPHVTNMSFEWVEGESLMMEMKHIAVSSGSACTSASLEPSYVLKHMGRDDVLAHSSIRFSLGRFTTEQEIDRTIEAVQRGVSRLRELSPLYEMHQQGVDLTKVKWQPH